jgi:4-amino-4-deoxy-L-arabinose transferase-like glycosyltransferase
LISLSRSTYILLFLLLCIVYIIGLFIPLMDNDSAHHANIGLRMYLTGDYVNLFDNENPYLDKPHLLFWLSALSYKIFGVTGFAYKLPSFLFTIVGTYSTYRLGKTLYNKETGKLAALLLASSFAYILANNDVRMDAILTTCIVFSIWHLVEFVNHKNPVNVICAALGLALGFSTKGHIAVFIPFVGILCYLLYKKEWKIIFNPKWILLIILFFVFITPVVYCYYTQFKMQGVRFILWEQNFERLRGERFGTDGGNDYFFFFHSFLWAFAPWSIIAFIALIYRIRNFLSRKDEWLTTGIFLVMILLVTFSAFKLPHYLNILFPFTSLITAAWLSNIAGKPKWIKIVFIIQTIVILILLILITIINVWAFPLQSGWVMAALVLFLSVVFYFFINKRLSLLQKSVTMSASTMVVVFFLLNSSFYPQLLHYQAGNELAKEVKGKIDPGKLFFWKDTYSPSLNFYLSSIRRSFSDSLFEKNMPVWVVFDKNNLSELRAGGYRFGKKYSHVDFGITRLSIKFLNPQKRQEEISEMIIAEVFQQ